MDDPLIESDSALQFHCPRCGQSERDDYEVIDMAVPTDWRCGACQRLFSVLVCECEHCAAEVVSVALSEAKHPAPSEVVCPQCGRRCLQNEVLDLSTYLA